MVSTFDGTAAERAARRDRRLYLSVAAALGQRAVLFLTTFAAMRLAFRTLGNELFGVWTTILSFAAMFSFADLGIGNGLLNILAPRSISDDHDAARVAVSSAFWSLAGLALVLEIALIAAAPWTSLFRDVSASPAAVTAALVAFGTIFCLALPLGTAQRIYLAYQEAYTYSAWEAAGACLSLAALGIVIATGGGLAALVAAAACAPLVAAAAGSVAMWRRRPWLRPALSLVSPAVVRTLMKMGLWFLALQTAAALAFGTDSLIAARELGAGAVSRYAVAGRLFSYLGMLLAVVLTPLWPAFGEAMARGDREWIHATLRRSILLSLLITGGGSAVLVAGARPLIRWWLGEPAVPPLSLLFGLAALAIVTGTITCYAIFLNGINALAFQAACGLMMSAAALAAKIFFVRRAGVAGLAWGTFLAYTIVSAIPMHLYVRRVLSRPADKMAEPHA